MSSSPPGGGEATAKRAATLTPMLRHYLEVKAENPDALLFYRMGDFYELFFEDAVTAAPILDVTLTARQKGSASEAPMAGVPHHALENYLGKALEAGFKVAICDQVEDPAEAKGLVRREVTRVVTPGTISELELLEGKTANLLGAILWSDDPPSSHPGQARSSGSGAGAFLDLSTGDFFVERWPDEETAADGLRLLSPRELLIPEGALPARLAAVIDETVGCRTEIAQEDLPRPAPARQRLLTQFEVSSLRGFGLEDEEPATRAAALALEYASGAARTELSHIRSIRVRQRRDFMALDETTLRNLEVFHNQRERTRRGTLLSVLDRTATAPGGRLLKDWLAHPLLSMDAILPRQDAVEDLLERPELRRCTASLAGVGDLERLATRAVLGSLSPREAATLRDSLREVPGLFACLSTADSRLLGGLAQTDPVADLAERLDRTLAETPSAQIRDGGIIAEGIDAELDRNRSLAGDGKKLLLELEAREREATGITNLKVRFNRVFGYYLEVTKSQQARVPEHYQRKQTLANAERYFTEELKGLEEEILGAEERQIRLEERIFGDLRETIARAAVRLRELAYALATLDVLVSFAEVAERWGYCRPRITRPGGEIVARDGRHPVVEAALGTGFVPNDIALDNDSAQIVLLTGPNMGGKSTYLRQVALIVLMAQIGSFVPAASAEISMVDRIFTRVGASDDLARGESTFMVEMIETANILRYATADSLVVLDEVGRGTATFDGLSLAWAIVEHLHARCGAKTLFATHYHELTELKVLLPRVVNRTMTVKEWDDRIVFLHRVKDGSADKSYGIQVARLAGLPESVLSRASEVLGNLEAQEYDFTGKPRLARGSSPASEGPDQLALFSGTEEMVVELLREVDLDRMTPLAALNFLSSLRERLG